MPLIHKIVRENGSIITNDVIKSFRYKEQRFDDGDLRLGGAISAFIECTVYGNSTGAVQNGETLKYYQVQGDGTEKLFGTFNAISSVPSKETYSFTAYDNLVKLDVDFSEKLNQIQNQFPMTLYRLSEIVADVAGIERYSSDIEPLYELFIPKFYTPTITCRTVLQLLGEVGAFYWFCTPNGELTNTNEYENESSQHNYRITATETSDSDEIYYKQNGLEYSVYNVTPIDCVVIKTTNGETWDKYPTDAAETNPYIISNVLVDNGLSFVSYLDPGYESIAQAIYESVLFWQCATNGGYRAATIKLFPFNNPFRAGNIVRVTDIKGVSFWTPIMSMEITDDAAILKSTGNESYQSGKIGYNNESIVSTRENDSINKLFEMVETLQTDKQDALTFDATPTENSTNPVTSGGVWSAIDAKKDVWYGTCDTAAATRVKSVICDGFALTTAAVINVYMEYGNNNPSPILNINDTGNVTIRRIGAVGGSHWWQSGEVVQFVYDGTRFRMINKTAGTNTDYGQVRLSDSTISTAGTGDGFAATPSAVKAAYDLADGRPTLDEIYPVGSIYMSVSSTADPATLFGGAWAAATSPASGIYAWSRTS